MLINHRPKFLNTTSCLNLIRKTSSPDNSKANLVGSTSFEDTHYWSPPVSFLADSEPPTALQWLRRRGPDLPNGMLQQLFRKRRVKVRHLGSARVQRASKDLVLGQGSRLLLPKEVAASASTLKEASVAAHGSKQLEQIGEDLRSRVLYKDADLLVVDKPAGLPVQGGGNIRVSLDALAAQHLRFGSSEAPRLVHRLDRDTSGAMILARTPDAAAWLSSAFQQPSQDLIRQSGGAAPPAWVRKTYWAVVESPRSGALPARGTINEPLQKLKDELSRKRPALTHYWTLGESRGLAWLELNPVTGRKHQLRMHTAFALGSPVVGDTLYGSSIAAREWARQSGRDRSPLLMQLRCGLQLHCRALQIKRPGMEAWSITAPLPQHMATLFAAHGWTAT